MDEAHPDPWSATEEDLFAAMREFRAADTPAVVATIVDVEGSAYRRPGAKMVVEPGSGNLGAVTAGCLEGPVTDLAADVLADGDPSVHTFDLMDDDEWGLGLGCNGIIDILLEPLDERWDAVLADLAARLSAGVATAVDSTDPRVEVGDRVIVDEAGSVPDDVESGGSPDDGGPGGLPDDDGTGGLPDEVGRSAEDALADLRATEGAATVDVETARGTVTAFLDWVMPAPDLLLFGTQNDVHPVARVGHQAGFRVVVASARGARADPDQFPDAHEVRSVHPTEVAEAVDVPERTYAVLMSHNALEDRLALASLLDAEVPYVGLMGPRERFQEIREALATEEGREPSRTELDRIATPVGLDLGGGAPTQIAISIVAEALAVHNGREGGRLRAREGPIHDRVAPPE